MNRTLALLLVALSAGCCSPEPRPEPAPAAVAAAPSAAAPAPASRPIAAEPGEFSGLHRLLGGPPVPAVDARVAAVSGESPQLVLLSAGSDDRVERGFRFSVYRGSDFVGMVVVEKVLKDSCGCRTLFTKEGFSIQPGDCAATRLQ